MKQQLEQFNQQIFEIQYNQAKRYNDNFLENNTLFFSKVVFSERGGLYDIVWFAGDYGYCSFSREEFPKYNPNEISNEGEYYEDLFNWFLDIILDHPNKIRSLQFTNYDVGSNGTRDWNFTRLIESAAIFENLISFKVQLYQRGDHNTPIITRNQNFGLDDSVTQLLKKMPNIYEFEVPTPPDDGFFELAFPSLSRITVQSNYTHGSFIKNLAKSPILHQLGSLDFTDVNFDEDLKNQNIEADDNEMFDEKADEIRKEVLAKTGNKKQAEIAYWTKIFQDEGLGEDLIRYELFISDLVPLTKDEFFALVRKLGETKQDAQDSVDYFEEKGVWDQNGNYVEPKEDDFFDFDEDFDTESDELNKRTPLEDYKALFEAIDKDKCFHLKLREYFLTQEQVFELHQLNSNIQFLHIPTHEDYYVSHRLQDIK